MSKIIPITILIVGCLATVGGYLWWSNINQSADNANYQQLSDEALRDYGQGNRSTEDSPNGSDISLDDPSISHERMATETVDCGNNPVCLEQKFDRCEPAIAVNNLDLSPLLGDAGLVSFQVEIIGPSNGRCKVESTYLKNPNPAWQNKVMVCNLDNQRNYESALSDLFNPTYCSGPLMEQFNLDSAPPAGAIPCDGGGYFVPGEGIKPEDVVCGDI